MKIGQITHYGSLSNYGALLQAYALQRALKELGHEVVLLRASFSFHNILRKWYCSPWRVWRAWRARRAEWAAEKKHPRRFAAFAAQYMTISEQEFHSLRDLQKAGIEADALVTGSDQVWSSKKPFPPYFLAFGPAEARRFSYAASVGSKARMDREYLANFREMLTPFSGISVRESEALQQCRAAGVEQAELVPDPVMLFPPETWREVFDLPTESGRGKYCLIYTVGHNPIGTMPELAGHCRENGWQLIVVPAQYQSTLQTDTAEVCYPDVPGFLSLIDQAELVVTDSFHGTVFSLLFNTPFVVIPKNRHDARFITLDEYFDLSRVYYRGDLAGCLAGRPDFAAVNSKMASLRRTGWDFLRRATAGAEQ